MNNVNKHRLEQVIATLEAWIRKKGWAGYDPYDILGLPLCLRLQRNNSKSYKALRKCVFYPIRQYPRISRRIAGVRKEINAKGMGLLVSAYCRLYEATKNREYLQAAIDRGEWLIENQNRQYPGTSWGYPFDWQSVVFIPRGTPSSVVTTAVGDGFWKLSKLTGEKKYYDTCCRICEFLIKGLNKTDIDKRTVCYSYTPVDHYLVHNANLFSAEYLARIGKKFGRDDWLTMGVKAGNYALREQNSDGSIYYWGKAQSGNSPNHLDCYHSGFEIRCLWGLWKSTGDDRFREAALRYLDFFHKTYIGSDGAIMTFPGNVFPLDIHSCAEAMLCTAVMSNANNDNHVWFARNIGKIVDKVVEQMQNKDGSFAYMAYGPKRIDRTPYMRWGQAWMLRAFAEVYFALEMFIKQTNDKEKK